MIILTFDCNHEGMPWPSEMGAPSGGRPGDPEPSRHLTFAADDFDQHVERKITRQRQSRGISRNSLCARLGSALGDVSLNVVETAVVTAATTMHRSMSTEIDMAGLPQTIGCWRRRQRGRPAALIRRMQNPEMRAPRKAPR